MHTAQLLSARLHSLCVEKFWGPAFYFYDLRKYVLVQLALAGFNVLQLDTDVIWLRPPYGLLHSAAYRRANVIAQMDNPLANAGMLYVQGVRPGDGAAWVLGEVARRVHLFLSEPAAVKRYVEWAQPPFYANGDEQSILNDVLISSITNRSVYLCSTF